jgi:hypothetical protein
MKKSKPVDGMRNISQANCSTLSSESCKVFIQVGAVHVLYFLKCKNEGVLPFLMWKIFPNFEERKQSQVSVNEMSEKTFEPNFEIK